MNGILRSFFCIELPPAVQKKLWQTVDTLRLVLPDLKWVSANALHITLKFLGEQEQRLLEDLMRSFEKRIASSGQDVIALSSSALGAFPNIRTARTLFAELCGDLVPLKAIASIVEDVSAEHGIPREKRPFKPHITLARTRRTETVIISPKDIPLFSKIEWQATSVTLMKSSLTPAGLIYTPLKIWEFPAKVF